jgi:hypothetical protein
MFGLRPFALRYSVFAIPHSLSRLHPMGGSAAEDLGSPYRFGFGSAMSQAVIHWVLTGTRPKSSSNRFCMSAM